MLFVSDNILPFYWESKYTKNLLSKNKRIIKFRKRLTENQLRNRKGRGLRESQPIQPQLNVPCFVKNGKDSVFYCQNNQMQLQMINVIQFLEYNKKKRSYGFDYFSGSFRRRRRTTYRD